MFVKREDNKDVRFSLPLPSFVTCAVSRLRRQDYYRYCVPFNCVDFAVPVGAGRSVFRKHRSRRRGLFRRNSVSKGKSYVRALSVAVYSAGISHITNFVVYVHVRT